MNNKSTWTHYLESEGIWNEDAEGARSQSQVYTLRQQIERARDWSDLEGVVEDAEEAYRRNELVGETVEQLGYSVQKKAREIPAHIDELRLSDLLKKALVRRIKSRLLGEMVLVIGDNVPVPPEAHGVIYRASELAQLMPKGPEVLKRIHAVKKTFDGDLIEEGEDYDNGE